MSIVSRYKATSKTLVGKLVPFFVAGDKVLKYLSAIAKSLDSVNISFLSWAEDRLVEAATTSQPIILEWSLTHRLRKYFANSNQSVRIITRALSEYTVIFENEEERSDPEGIYTVADIYAPEDINDAKIPNIAERIVVRNNDEIINYDTDIIITLPKHKASISKEQYLQKAKQYTEPYLIYESKYMFSIKQS